MTTTTPSPFKLIWGVKAIAEAIGRNPRATFGMLEKGHMPAKKIGRRWVAQENQLRKALGEDQTVEGGKCAAIDDLKVHFVAECLKIAAIKAAHGSDNILIGDWLNCERDIRLAVENLREASRSFSKAERQI
jgi:hypothetical protein